LGRDFVQIVFRDELGQNVPDEAACLFKLTAGRGEICGDRGTVRFAGNLQSHRRIRVIRRRKD